MDLGGGVCMQRVRSHCTISGSLPLSLETVLRILIIKHKGKNASSIEHWMSIIYEYAFASCLVTILAFLHIIPYLWTVQIGSNILMQSPAKIVKHHPTPTQSIIIWSKARPPAERLHRTMLRAACALAGDVGWRSTSRVPHIWLQSATEL